MSLDMPTISVVAVSMTAMLGFVLILSWYRERTSALTGWWGLGQLIMADGILLAAVGSARNELVLVTWGQATIVLSGAIMWMAARQFEGRPFQLLWIAVWPAAFLAVAFSGLLDVFDERLILACATLAVLRYITAIEFARNESDDLPSRLPTVILLLVVGTGYLAWLPLTLVLPLQEAGNVFVSAWFPAVVLFALLGRIGLGFVVLSLVKERAEQKQRHDALTDPLTGLPNRRALFDAADALAGHSKYLKGDPISVLVCDLDHFKRINDTFGHRLGDRVLQVFASAMTEKLDTGSILGRLGGEEFAAILPGADSQQARETAESIRTAFAASAQSIDGAAVCCTVSIGAASHDDIDCDLVALFHKADGALYAAKHKGRNRVELLGPQEELVLEDPKDMLRSALNHRDGRELPAYAKTRRYRARNRLRAVAVVRTGSSSRDLRD
jgi:diguanylate cyclase (GGDEF)-like protein